MFSPIYLYPVEWFSWKYLSVTLRTLLTQVISLMKRQFVLAHTISQTEVRTLLDSWVTNTSSIFCQNVVSIKKSLVLTNYLTFCLHKPYLHIIKYESIICYHGSINKYLINKLRKNIRCMMKVIQIFRHYKLFAFWVSVCLLQLINMYEQSVSKGRARVTF